MGTIALLFKAGTLTSTEIDQIIIIHNQIAAIIGMAAFLIVLAVKIKQKVEIDPNLLGSLIQSFVASGGIVKAIFLFLFGFHPEIFPKLSDLVVSLGVTSSCLVFLAICTLIKAFSQPKSSP
ncbi:hypothetical protein PCC8801_1082 [Rippkaea orientalis PCC 8801]|uniref:Uncharacterized protein n=1 Tax=Rippkaea orientalis (strain PCC 8801 / RF-1) TaxID=41431 RepID=B7K115_RIPO1|nr:hypothetical protein [Rippkaea orientalis]ACK65156.1 hypothetical protein PCC8801_1082 [Rippkaea orientalis PCC 8801]